MTDKFNAAAIAEDARYLIYQVIDEIARALHAEFEGCGFVDGRPPTGEEMQKAAEAFADAFGHVA